MANRRSIEAAIYAWRDGASYNTVNPLDRYPQEQARIFWDEDAMKDLARVISHMLDGETPPYPSGTVPGAVVTDSGELPA